MDYKEKIPPYIKANIIHPFVGQKREFPIELIFGLQYIYPANLQCIANAVESDFILVYLS